MERDILEFVAACVVCPKNKASHQPPSGLLQPLMVPSRPWSHIVLDYMMGLPTSAGNETINYCGQIRHPCGLVSDQGPQFVILPFSVQQADGTGQPRPGGNPLLHCGGRTLLSGWSIFLEWNAHHLYRKIGVQGGTGIPATFVS